MTDTELRALYDRYLAFVKTKPSKIGIARWLYKLNDEELDKINALIDKVLSDPRASGLSLRKLEK